MGELKRHVDALYENLVTEAAKIRDSPKHYPYFKTYYAVHFAASGF